MLKEALIDSRRSGALGRLRDLKMKVELQAQMEVHNRR